MYKTKLQELCHQKLWNVPEYSTTKQGQDHNPTFHATVTVNGVVFHNQCVCKSSKQAQNEAAKLALDHFSLPPPQSSLPSPPSPPLPSPQPQPQPQPQICTSSFPQPRMPGSSFPHPSFPSSSGIPTPSIDQDGTFNTIQILQPKIKDNDQPPIVDGTAMRLKENDKLEPLHLYKNQLQNYAQKRNLNVPVYSSEREGPPHASRFKSKVTIDGNTFESPKFYCTLKDAEHAAAKVALMSLPQCEAQESQSGDDSGLYKNLLQELAQKEGFRLPVYTTSRSGEAHAPLFISTVEIEGESFTGQTSKSKKQAEMSAAKNAYNVLKERKSSSCPLIVTPASGGQTTPEFLLSRLHLDPTNDLQQYVRPKSPTMSASSIAAGIVEEERENAKSISHQATLSSRSDTMLARDRSSSSLDTVYDSPSCSNGLKSDMTSSHAPSIDYTNLILSSISKSTTENGTSASKRICICPRVPNMKFPEGSTVFPMSDDKWVVFSLLKSDDNQI